MTVREIDGTRVKIGPIEAFDGTPVVDIKSASAGPTDDRRRFIFSPSPPDGLVMVFF